MLTGYPQEKIGCVPFWDVICTEMMNTRRTRWDGLSSPAREDPFKETAPLTHYSLMADKSGHRNFFWGCSDA